MARNIRGPHVKITADDKEVASAAKGAESSLSKLGRIGGVAAKAMGALAIAGAAAGGALFAFSQKHAKVIDATSKMARSLGLGVSQFQAMAMVAEEAGVSQEALGKSLRNMQRNVVELSEGTQTAVDAFARLGIAQTDLLGMGGEEQFEAIAEKLNDIEDPAIRSATAMDIFGKSGGQVINMLADFGAKADEARAFQERFGLAVSDLDAAAIEKANDSLGRVWEILKGVGNMIATYVAPIIVNMTERLLDSGISAQIFGDLGAKAMAAVFGMVDFLRKGVLRLEIAFKTVSVAVLNFARGATSALATVAKALDSIDEFFGNDGIRIGNIFDGAEEAFAQGVETGTKQLEESRAALENYEATAESIRKIREEVLNDLALAPNSAVPNLLYDPEQFTAPIKAAGAASRSARAEEMAKMEQMEQQHAQNVLAIQNMSNAAKLGSVLGSGQDVLSAMGDFNDKALKISKVFGAAQALVSTYQGAAEALKLPFPANLAAAAKVVASGLGLVSAIRGVSKGGGGGSGVSAAAGAVQAQTAAAAPGNGGQTVAISLSGDPTGIGEGFIRQLIPKLNEAQRDGMRLQIV